MQLLGHPSPKPTTVWSNMREVSLLDMGKLSKQEREKRTTLKTTRFLAKQPFGKLWVLVLVLFKTQFVTVDGKNPAPVRIPQMLIGFTPLSKSCGASQLVQEFSINYINSSMHVKSARKVPRFIWKTAFLRDSGIVPEPELWLQ